tara:strand:- start:1010 stop:1489 length:480 start_codon:yes stop_codon:yes gene_type:complete
MKFDPFVEENLFYKYNLKVSEDEVKQLSIVKNDRYAKDNNFTTYFTLNILNFPMLKNLKTKIETILKEHELILSNSWVQSYKEDNYHKTHIHDGAKKSGILYLTNSKTPTIFYNRVFKEYYHYPEKNTLLLFPGFVPHEVRPVKEKEERLIVSFNAIYE